MEGVTGSIPVSSTQIQRYQIRMLITPATSNSTSAIQSTFTTLLISELSPSIDQVNNKNEATLINPIQIAIGWYSLLKTDSNKKRPTIANRTARCRSRISVFVSETEIP